jgi:hypothetical protein
MRQSGFDMKSTPGTTFSKFQASEYELPITWPAASTHARKSLISRSPLPSASAMHKAAEWEIVTKATTMQSTRGAER